MIIAFAIAIVIIAFLVRLNTKRLLAVGKQIYHKELKTNESHILVEEVEFKNSIECTKNYNNLVSQFSKKLNKYDIDSWTYNRFPILNGFVEIFRYGNHIKMIKTIDK
jgi:hypothetical protein